MGFSGRWAPGSIREQQSQRPPVYLLLHEFRWYVFGPAWVIIHIWSAGVMNNNRFLLAFLLLVMYSFADTGARTHANAGKEQLTFPTAPDTRPSPSRLTRFGEDSNNQKRAGRGVQPFACKAPGCSCASLTAKNTARPLAV